MIRKIRKAKITAKQAASDEKIRQQAYKDFPPCCPNCGKTLETPTQVHNCMVEKTVPTFEELAARYTRAEKIGSVWKVSIKIGVQEFQLGIECDNETEADWFRFMLGKAFHEMLKEAK
jgi:hypothetical protein